VSTYFGAAALSAALVFCQPVIAAHKKTAKPTVKVAAPAVEEHSENGQLETYQDLIQKAQNLTLQQDRLQTSQVLLRGLQHEIAKGERAKSGTAYKEIAHALDELTSVFYTEKAQNLFADGESQSDLRPRDAIEPFQEALKSEDRNVSVLKALARVHLKLDECDKADLRVKQAEEVNPVAAEVKLLRLQVLFCQKNYEALSLKLSAHDPELEPVEKFTRALQMQDILHQKEPKKDLKKARALVNTWEAQYPDDPEVYNWKWQLSKVNGSPDRVAAAKYSQLCQNLTPRKRKSFSLDVDLCKGKEAADAFLKENATQKEEPRL
jgi:tetratricopeptide (TPR) repeat protein